MCLAFLHGEFVVYGMLFASVITIAIASFVGWYWWRFTARSAVNLIIGYLMFALPPTIIFIGNTDSFLLSALSFIVALPLSFIFVLGLFSIESDRVFAAMFLACVGVNAAVIYLKAAKAAREVKQ